jgi:hypothetical protein
MLKIIVKHTDMTEGQQLKITTNKKLICSDSLCRVGVEQLLIAHSIEMDYTMCYEI